MASVEHCLYCFEALAAHLEKRSPMSLYQVINSWEEYPKGLEDDDGDDSTDDDKADVTADVDYYTSTSSASKRPRLLSPHSQQHTTARPPTTGRTTPSSSSSASPSNAAAFSTSSPNPSSTATSSIDASEPSFVPVGIGRKTSQRSASLTESPLFVTWNKRSRRGEFHLRGCIGTFETQPLASGLASYAVTSAVHDTRFDAVTPGELPLLEVAVTLLTDFEPCNDPMDWQLGVHGLRISFYYRSRRYGACYLPDVAVEQGWTKEQTLISLMQKGGWTGKKDKWREVADLKVVRYQGKKESVEYDEYRRWKDWVDAEK